MLNTTLEFAGRTYPVEVQFDLYLGDKYPSLSLVRLLQRTAQKGDLMYLPNGKAKVTYSDQWASLELPLVWLDERQKWRLLKEYLEVLEDEEAPRLGWGETCRNEETAA